MLRLRFSLTSLLIAMTFVGVCFTVWISYRTWHARNYRSEIVSNLLYKVVRNGDSLAQVTECLGVAGVDIDTNRSRYSNRFQEQMRSSAASQPAGVLETDKFLDFDFGKYGIVLQFRGDRLVNHNPNSFGLSSPISFEKVRRTPVYDKLSELRWQMGLPQGVAGLVAGSALIAAITLATRRHYPPIALQFMIAGPVVLCVAILGLAIHVRPYSLIWLVTGLAGLVAWKGTAALAKERIPRE